jgi:hypothetical protein
MNRPSQYLLWARHRLVVVAAAKGLRAVCTTRMPPLRLRRTQLKTTPTVVVATASR